MPDDVQVHDGFADEHEKTAIPILDEVKRLIEEKGVQNVFTVRLGLAHLMVTCYDPVHSGWPLVGWCPRRA